MAIILAVLVGFAALGFDLAYVRLARMQMQNASDAAAHAAIVSLRLTSNQATARSTAISVAGANNVLGNRVQLADADVVFGRWDFAGKVFSAGTSPANSVSVSGRRADTSAADGNVSLSFGRALGFGEASVARSSIASFRSRYTMFEVDVTGSFLTNSCALDQAIAADLQFLDALYGAGVITDRIGLDIFTGGALHVTPLQSLNTNYAAIRAQWKGDGLSSRVAAHTSGLGACTHGAIWTTGDYSPCPGGGQWPNQVNVAAGIPNIDCAAGDFHYSPTTTVFGGTNIGSGIKSGLDAFTAVANTGEVRSIVVFTDGGPMCCEKAQGGGKCGTINGATGLPWNPCCADGTLSPCSDNTGGAACKCAQDVATYGVTQADAAYAAGIDLYVLAFGADPNWIAYAKSLARGRGFEIDTSDPSKLSASLLQIANAIPVALVK